MSAKEETQNEEQKPDPVAMLQELHDLGQRLDPTQAEAYLTQVYEDRKLWRGERDARMSREYVDSRLPKIPGITVPPLDSGRVLPDFRIGLPSGRHVSGTLGNPGPNTLQVPLQAVLAFSPAAAPDYGQHKGQAPDTPRRRSGTDGMLQHRCGTNKHGR
jgi:hypothetical protein